MTSVVKEDVMKTCLKKYWFVPVVNGGRERMLLTYIDDRYDRKRWGLVSVEDVSNEANAVDAFTIATGYNFMNWDIGPHSGAHHPKGGVTVLHGRAERITTRSVWNREFGVPHLVHLGDLGTLLKVVRASDPLQNKYLISYASSHRRL